ncbi:MAG: hypothetical protein ABI615_02295 [Chthoniobacterales bacterium]
MGKSQTAFLFSAERLAEKGLYMWTFTFADVLAIKETRKLWNHLLVLLRRRWPDLCGLRVFELHETHGLHVHLITNRYIRVEEARKLAKQAGWERIHVMRTTADGAKYLAKYLNKEREPCFKRWRLWAGFGKWDWSRVKDIQVESPRSVIWNACAEAFQWKGNKGFREKQKMVDSLYSRTIEEGWQLGKGPDGDRYDECSMSELFLRPKKT